MDSYATLTDYELRYGDVKADDEPRIETLLSDATSMILANGGDSEPQEEFKNAYTLVCCAMAHRVVTSPAWAVGGVTQHTQTAGSFSESYSFGNPNGDLFLTKNERKTLGLSSQKLGSIRGDLHEG